MVDIKELKKKIVENLVEGLELKGKALTCTKKAKLSSNKAEALLDIAFDEVGEDRMESLLDEIYKDVLDGLLSLESIKEAGLMPISESEKERLLELLKKDFKKVGKR